MRTLLAVAVLPAALGACETMMYGAREGTIEYPGSGAGPNAVPVYVVKDRDTVDNIAQRFGVSTQSVVDRNKLQPPYTLRAGQNLEIPGARVVSPQEAAATPPPASNGPVKQETLPPPGEGNKPPPAAGEPTPLSPPTKEVTVAATPPGPAPKFQWPLKGKILTSYGGGASGQKSDGIEIAAEKGAPVRAADGGKVIYVGSDIARYGNLVLVEHNGGYITAYGNNDQVLVKKDETVKKGQVIAKAGGSGEVASPRLHFEVRRGGNKTIDPMTVLPAQ